MSGQLGLFERGRERSIDERFREFVKLNPEIVAEFERRALALIARGKKHFSADAILHSIRFDTALATEGDEGWKCNNSYTSRLSRWFELRHPENRGFFEQRKLLSE